MVFKSILGLTAIVLFSSSTTALALDFNPGNYTVTSSVQMPGMPEGTIPPQTMTQCVTEKDPIPKNDASVQGCDITNIEQKNNTVSWEMECQQQGTTMKSQGHVTYAGDSFNGSVTMNMGPQAGNMTVITTMTGKRVGDCQKTE